MQTLFIPEEQEFRRWVREVVMECLEKTAGVTTGTAPPGEETLLNRKQAAGLLHISLVTLHERMKHGLPFYKQGGRVYFVRSELMAYVRRTRKIKPPYTKDFTNQKTGTLWQNSEEKH